MRCHEQRPHSQIAPHEQKRKGYGPEQQKGPVDLRALLSGHDEHNSTRHVVEHDAGHEDPHIPPPRCQEKDDQGNAEQGRVHASLQHIDHGNADKRPDDGQYGAAPVPVSPMVPDDHGDLEDREPGA